MHSMTLALWMALAALDWPTRGWKTSTPEAENVDAAVLEAFHQELASGKHGYVDSMLVIRNGRIVFEKTYTHDYDRLFEGKGERGPYNYYDPDWHPYYRKGPFHTMQSVSKSVTSALIGIAKHNGAPLDLDAAVLPLFEGFRTQGDDPRWSALTLRHLLTMTSGNRMGRDHRRLHRSQEQLRRDGGERELGAVRSRSEDGRRAGKGLRLQQRCHRAPGADSEERDGRRSRCVRREAPLRAARDRRLVLEENSDRTLGHRGRSIFRRRGISPKSDTCI